MEYDDVIYLSILVFTIVFGYFFKQILDTNVKKWTSTLTGFIIVLSVSGVHIYHSIICTTVNAFIILYTKKKLCHIYSFGFSFLYLLFFRTTVYFGIPYPPLHTNLVQMILTLKVVGLAFEVHDLYSEKKENEIVEDKVDINNKFPTFMDIFHFAYCYIGVLTGPYYSYKTYNDYFKNGFYKYTDCKNMVLKKLAFVPLYSAVYLITTHYYPIQYAESDEFYLNTTFWFRLWYITPVFTTFRMRIYIGLVLSEVACIMAGLGAYPEISEPKPGKGPSSNFNVIEKMQKNESLKLKNKYTFEAVHNINIWHTETDPLVRTSIHYWNMCVQYWMAFVVYKRFPSKTFRTAATFVVSAVWHGVYAGYYLCLCSVPFYLFIEDIWEALLRKEATETKRKILNVVFWIVRTQAFSYMGMAFSLLSMKNGIRYYSSIYYVYHLTSVLGLILGLTLKKFKQNNISFEKKSKPSTIDVKTETAEVQKEIKSK